jgi:ATP-dependent DNA helicase Rep
MSAGLNPSQHEAVVYSKGPLLVLAGAGSGKTRVITFKIVHLIQSGFKPESIAAITFTNKAAAEMMARTKSLLGSKGQKVLICTFHSLGVRILRQDGYRLGFNKQFSILDSDDVLSLLKDAGATTDLSTARRWQWAISAHKNNGLNANEALALATSESQRQVALVMQKYEERLSAYQSVDFDDLLKLPLVLLQKFPEVREYWQSELRHLLIDEYQDTNVTQYELLKLLVGYTNHESARFTAVGDDDQSIYGWRGATLDNLRSLPIDFPNLKVIKLEQNYRSTGAILRAANQVIQLNPKIYPKTLFSELGEGAPVLISQADHEEHEAERLVSKILSIKATTASSTPLSPTVEWRHFAVLYRANHQARILEQSLRKAQIPYKVSGGQSFFDRAEIKDLCAWMRLISNNKDDPAFLRAVTTPKRGIGHQTLKQLGQFSNQFKLSLFEALFSNSLSTCLSLKAIAGLHEFGRMVNDMEYKAKHILGYTQAIEFLKDWLKELNFEKHLYDLEDNEKAAASRWTNVLDFCEWMAKRCGGVKEDFDSSTLISEAKSLLEVIQTIAILSTLTEKEKDSDVVTLSTLHAAKGLEWPHVVMVGVSEGLLPFQNDSDLDMDASTLASKIEEERRLMYVGITRAQHSLTVSWSKRRKKGKEFIQVQPSRFIHEMGLDSIKTFDDPREKLRALRAEFAQRIAVTNPTT